MLMATGCAPGSWSSGNTTFLPGRPVLGKERKVFKSTRQSEGLWSQHFTCSICLLISFFLYLPHTPASSLLHSGGLHTIIYSADNESDSQIFLTAVFIYWSSKLFPLEHRKVGSNKLTSLQFGEIWYSHVLFLETTHFSTTEVSEL